MIGDSSFLGGVGSEHLLSVPEQSLADSIFSLEEASVKALKATHTIDLAEATDIWRKVWK